jgi:hypothetical protein
MKMVLNHLMLSFTTLILTISTHDNLEMQSIENHLSFNNYNARYEILLLTFFEKVTLWQDIVTH